ncbi:hypothetical protein GCM10028810_20170 [Spirosoma litoris]
MWLFRVVYDKWGWPGIGVFVLIIVLVSTCKSFMDQSTYESSLREPSIGDLYIIKRSTDYYAHRLVSISNDSLCLQKPNYELGTFEDKDVSSLKTNPYLFAKDSVWMSKSELSNLLKKDRLKIYH